MTLDIKGRKLSVHFQQPHMLCLFSFSSSSCREVVSTGLRRTDVENKINLLSYWNRGYMNAKYESKQAKPASTTVPREEGGRREAVLRDALHRSGVQAIQMY